ncbi:hypothetical protein OH76DRAFT_1483363 [Lentinus brumalis]|uniref:DUF6533 domain-containing protein n=1 Tax=Lentinus brumalis TaxID=2498619 RepID=A0A371D9E9_9APHY|nr:hypothetical protein OH76DRAFT_1483363 [Polyporus brumalis]
MSSDADAAAETIALFASLYTGNYCSMAASVLFIYDAFVTSDREAVCFGTTKRTGAAFLFFANKWISMSVYVMVLVTFATLPSDKVSSLSLSPGQGRSDGYQSCSSLVIVLWAAQTLQFVPGAVFSALRAYVLSRSKPLTLLVLALSLAPVGANLVPYGYQVVSFIFIIHIGTDAVQGVVVIISRVPLIAADCLLVYITWTKLNNWSGLKDITKARRPSLSDILFRGGTIYFVVLFVLNVLHLILSATAVAGNEDGSYVTQFTAPLTAILTSHFLLELQEAERLIVRLDPGDPLHSSRNPWDSAPSFISSLGGFVNPALSAQSEDDDGIDLQVCSHSNSSGEKNKAQVEVPEAAASASPSLTA